MDNPAAPVPQAEEPRALPRTLPDRLLGAVGGAMVLGALVVLLFGGERDAGRASAIVEAPALRIVEPLPADTVRGALRLVFESDRELARMPGGWGVDSLHIHAGLNGREVMPAPDEVVRLGAGRYAWTLRRPPDGVVGVRLYWSGPDHRPIAAGASEAVQIFVR